MRFSKKYMAAKNKLKQVKGLYYIAYFGYKRISIKLVAI